LLLRALIRVNPSDAGHPRSTVNDPTLVHLLRDPALVMFVVSFAAPFAILECASAGESFAGVPGQTWLCHHFFPTQFPPL
jgi:hypothetical protein